MDISNQNYEFGNRMLTLAVTAMLAERSAHEGLHKADRYYLRWLDVDSDLPPHLKARLDAWRAGLLGEHRASDSQESSLSGLRDIPVERALDHAYALIEMANDLEALRRESL